MKKSILNLVGSQELSKKELKATLGGRPPFGPCTDSNIVCTNVGNSGCPVGQGCYLQDPDSNYAICQCL